MKKIKLILRTLCELGIILGIIIMAIRNNIRKEIEKKHPELKKKWYLKVLNIMEVIIAAGFWVFIVYVIYVWLS